MLHPVACLKGSKCFQIRFASFKMDFIAFWVVLDLRLASFTFDFKPSQLRSVLDTNVRKGLWIILPPHRLVTWFPS